MDEDEIKRICSLLQRVAEEGETSAVANRRLETGIASSSSSSSGLSEALVLELYSIFGNPPVASSSGTARQSSGVQGFEFSSSRKSGRGRLGIKAAGVYVGMLSAPDCPLYSLFCPVAFNSLLRCVRASCKQTKSHGNNRDVASEKRNGSAERNRKGTRKGKKVTSKERQQQPLADDSSVEGQEASAAVDAQEVLPVLVSLQCTLQLLHFKEHQESLKALIALLVDVPLLVSSGTEEDSEHRRSSPQTSWSHPTSFLSLSFAMLETLLASVHGDPLATVVLILRAVSPIFLLSHTEGTAHQQAQVKAAALQFVKQQLLGSGSSSMREAVNAFCHYLCFKAPERTDGRQVAVDAVLTLLRALSYGDWCQFASFLYRFSRSKAQRRLFAVDMSLALLMGLSDPFVAGNPTTVPLEEDGSAGLLENSARRKSPTSLHGDAENEGWGCTCLQILLDRSSDKLPSVRARSISNLAQAIEVLAKESSYHMHLQTLLGFITRDLGLLMLQRCLDSKAAVRKAALVLMKKSASLLGRPPDGDIVEAMGAACGDTMVSIRKSALAALSEVVRRYPLDKRSSSEWLKSALPLALDNEVSLQEECLELFHELVLDRVASICCKRATVGRLQSGWSLSRKKATEVFGSREGEDLSRPVLMLLKEIADDSTISSVVKRACTSLGRQGRLHAEIALALQSLISDPDHGFPEGKQANLLAPRGAWFLLSEVSAFVPKAVSWDFLRTRWQLLDNHGIGRQSGQEETNQTIPTCDDAHDGESAVWAADRVHLLQTVANVAVELPCEAAADLAGELLDRLESFNMHTAEVWAHVEALTTLSKKKAVSMEEGQELVTVWVYQLLDKAGTLLQAYVSTCDSPWIQHAGVSAEKPTPLMKSGRQSQALGENRMPPCQSGASTQSQSKGKKGFETPATGRIDSHSAAFSGQVVTAIFTVGALAVVCPTAKAGPLVTILQALVIPKKSLPGKENNGSEAEGVHFLGKVSPEVCVQAWVALSKLCLADEDLAKRCIPFFFQELERSGLAAVRNNITQAMTDFFVRYPILVDGYVHKLTKVLRDGCEVVRRQAFILLARLLQRDYVKWRGVLFHQFLLAIVDDSPKICELANFLFKSILKTKAPLLAYNSFVEAIFVLNDCRSHSGFSTALPTSESERKLFSLRGNHETMSSKRMNIYTALLQQMAPEHLLATSAKLCAEILAGAADGVLDLNDVNAQGVLQDALRILASKELRRVAGHRASNGGANVDDEEGEAAAGVAAAKGRIVTQLMKKNLVQNAIPIFIELKRLLESKNSPLLGLLMESMRVMLKDYKNEMEEILVADKQLHKELLYDIQKHEASKARTKVAAAVASSMMPPASNEQTPMIIGSKSKGPPSHQLYLKQASHGFADAVADVAAHATVAAVLHEVATGSSTPLRVMSLPRLRPSVWNSQKELSVRVPACSTTATMQFVPSQLAAGEKLEAVRRRQSFGLQSPSSKAILNPKVLIPDLQATSSCFMPYWIPFDGAFSSEI
ncbi:unnamed protein product [Sphagnum compactum]